MKTFLTRWLTVVAVTLLFLMLLTGRTPWQFEDGMQGVCVVGFLISGLLSAVSVDK